MEGSNTDLSLFLLMLLLYRVLLLPKKIKPASQEIAWLKSTAISFLYHIKEKCGFLYLNLQCTSQLVLKQLGRCNTTFWVLIPGETWQLLKNNDITKQRKQTLIFPWRGSLCHWPKEILAYWKIMPIWKGIQNKTEYFSFVW